MDTDVAVETTDIDKVEEVTNGTIDTAEDTAPAEVSDIVTQDETPAVETEPVENHIVNDDTYEPILENAEINNEEELDEEEDETTDRPVIELFVKAAVDKMKNGSCPICHRYFLILYVLREKGCIDLVVTTFLPENPPKEVLEFSNGKHFPVAKVHKGLDAKGVDLAGLTCDTIDELDSLIERFDCDEMATRQQSTSVDKAERCFEGLYNKLNAFLKNKSDDPKPILRILEKIDDHLHENDTKFLVMDTMTRADCYLLPVLQHIRVAGKTYKDFQIPTEMSYLWEYLKGAYETSAFKEACPADREIIHHYQEKAFVPAKIKRKRASLMGESRSFDVPEPVIDVPVLENGVEDGTQ